MGGGRGGGAGVRFFGLVQPELPLLPSSSFCQLESRNLHILTCSIFWNLDDVVRPSVGVVHGNCKLEITPLFSSFFFQCQFSSYLGRSFFGQAISDYVFFLVPHPRSEPHIHTFMLSLAEIVSSLVGREGVCIGCHPSIHPFISTRTTTHVKLS